MEEKEGPWWGLSWWIWALACLAVAVVYLVVDTEGVSTAGWKGWMLRWGHSLCWLLLAASFVIRTTPVFRWANLVAAAGGLVYVAFLVLKFTEAKTA